VAGQPGHAPELAAVGGLVEGDPEAEVARPEAVAALGGDDVGDHVPDGALAVGPDRERGLAVGRGGLVGAGHGQVVLAEDALGDVAEQGAGLGPGDGPGAGAHGLALGHLLGQGAQDAAQGGQVGLDPLAAVEGLGHRRRQVPAEAGELGHGPVGGGRQLGELA
jgi:hypothetical protein